MVSQHSYPPDIFIESITKGIDRAKVCGDKVVRAHVKMPQRSLNNYSNDRAFFSAPISFWKMLNFALETGDNR